MTKLPRDSSRGQSLQASTETNGADLPEHEGRDSTPYVPVDMPKTPEAQAVMSEFSEEDWGKLREQFIEKKSAVQDENRQKRHNEKTVLFFLSIAREMKKFDPGRFDKDIHLSYNDGAAVFNAVQQIHSMNFRLRSEVDMRPYSLNLLARTRMRSIVRQDGATFAAR
jgi:hypothetical protein